MLEAEPRDAVEHRVRRARRGRQHGNRARRRRRVGARVEAARRPGGAAPRNGAPGRVPGRLDSGRADALGLTTARAATAADLLVVCTEGTELRAVIVPAASADVRPVQGIDPEGGLHAAAARTGRRCRRPDRPDRVGNCRHVRPPRGRAPDRRSEPNDAHSGTRPRVGAGPVRPADRVVPSRSPSARRRARRDRGARRDAPARPATSPNPLTAALAKATAGRTAQTVATHCQQVLAGIGFTTDHPFHRYLKRTMLLDGLFGSADAIAIDVGRQLLAARHVPTLIEL